MTTRRAFLGAFVAAAAGGVPGWTAHAAARPIKALAIDGFVVFDPRPIAALAERLVPGKGADLVATWRTRQFEYTWLRTAMHRYADFWAVTADALAFAASAARVDLSAPQRAQLMDAYLHLGAYPDVRPALTAFRDAGLRLAFLTNLSPRMLDAAIDSAGLADLFAHRLSTDTARTYKPDPRAYQLGVDAFGLAIEEIGFVASAGWDAAGAKAHGYPTFRLNRPSQPVEELGVRPDGIGATLVDLAGFLRSRGLSVG
jgi:2-haloacid dehalogenase